MSQLQDSDYRCLHRGPWLAPDLDSLDICAPILLYQYIYICTVIGQCWGMAVAYRCKNKIRVWLSSMIDKRISVTRSSGTLCSSCWLNFSFLFYRGGRWLRGLVVFCLLSCILPKLCFYTMVSSSNNRCCSVASSYLHTPLRVLHNICFFFERETKRAVLPLSCLVLGSFMAQRLGSKRLITSMVPLWFPFCWFLAPRAGCLCNAILGARRGRPYNVKVLRVVCLVIPVHSSTLNARRHISALRFHFHAKSLTDIAYRSRPRNTSPTHAF